MAIVHEIRWECDYCDNVSPVLHFDEKPRGWVTELHPSHVLGYPNLAALHFCCEDHHYSHQIQRKIQ